MSLILDALHRADQERSNEASGPKLQPSQSPSEQQPKPWRRWLLEVIVISLIGVGIFYSQSNTEQLRNLNNITGNGATAPAILHPQPAVTPASKIPLARPPRNAHTTEITTNTLESNTNSKEELAATRKNSDPAITALYKQPAKKLSIIDSSEHKPLPNTVEKKLLSSQQILQKIPLLSQFSTNFQASVPSINYSVHVFSANENTGFIKLNGITRKVGAEVSPGLKVIAILKDSVVLDYRGKQFRLLALNSWVNFN